jgi:hypothetical protein
MPLKKGRKNIGENIEELERTGRPYKQALAIALKTANVKPKYNKNQLKIGKQIELEHTTNLKVAEKIAKDHLDEFPDYYTHLVKMEKMLKKKVRK